MAERRVSVRLAAVGGDRLKADLAAIGREGKAALAAIAGGSAPASHGLAETGEAARTLVTRLEAVSARAGAAAATMRGLEAAGGVVARIDRTTGVTGGLRRDAADIEAYGRALDDTRAKYNPMFAAVRSYRAELAAIRAAHATGAISADEMNAAIGRTRTAALASIAAIKGRTTAIGQMASGSRLAAMQSRMLLFQLNDIGVSLAGGMSPLMVLVQQGSQITQMYAGQGGVNAALRQTADLAKGAVAGVGSAARGVLGLARAHPVLTAAVAVAAAGLAGLRHEINATAETQVSYGDVTLAVWQTGPRRRGRPGEAGLRRDRRLGGAGLRRGRLGRRRGLGRHRRRRARHRQRHHQGLRRGLRDDRRALRRGALGGRRRGGRQRQRGARRRRVADQPGQRHAQRLDRQGQRHPRDAAGLDASGLGADPGDPRRRALRPLREPLCRGPRRPLAGLHRRGRRDRPQRSARRRLPRRQRPGRGQRPRPGRRGRRRRQRAAQRAAAAAAGDDPAARRPRTCGRSSRRSSPASTRSAMRSAAPTRT